MLTQRDKMGKGTGDALSETENEDDQYTSDRAQLCVGDFGRNGAVVLARVVGGGRVDASDRRALYRNHFDLRHGLGGRGHVGALVAVWTDRPFCAHSSGRHRLYDADHTVLLFCEAPRQLARAAAPVAKRGRAPYERRDGDISSDHSRHTAHRGRGRGAFGGSFLPFVRQARHLVRRLSLDLGVL